MAQNNRSTTRSVERQTEDTQAWPTPVLSRAELASAFSQALDLAEGGSPGHAARVCYVAMDLAQAVDLSPAEQRTVFFAALLHDAGAAPASAETCRVLNITEESVFGAQPGKSPQQVALQVAPSRSAPIVEMLRAHAKLSSEIVSDLGFGPDVQRAVATHHERWDGRGYPRALKQDKIPIAGRVVAAADLIESVIAAESNPLAARRRLVGVLAEEAGALLDPELAVRATELAKSDAFWLGLHNEALVQELPARCPEAGAEQEDPADLAMFAAEFSALADLKGEHTAGQARRTAEIADQLCEQLSLPAEQRELVRIAALLHDIGLLGVPARVIAKPDILTLQEMEIMRSHPAHSQMIVETLPGMEEVARWVGAHHERPDGRGYPEMLEGEGVPLEARILAVVDTYVALTSARPYRKALSHEDAQEVLLGGAGTQLDRKLVQLCCALPLDATSSRTARRSRRKR